MPGLIINGNVSPECKQIVVRYRLLGSGSAFTEITLAADATLPYTVSNVPAGTYELGIKTQCNNNAWSDWVAGTSTPCAVPSSFAVVPTEDGFTVNYGVDLLQVGIRVEVTDPNGGVTIKENLVPGTSTFPITAAAGVTGAYTFRALAICDNDITPAYVSAYTNPIQLLWPAV
jgi:hypothetical protein